MNLATLVDVIALVVMPFYLAGVVNRVKSLWSGRKGPPVYQLVHDVVRLAKKSPVYSTTVTPLFRIAPHVFLISALASALVTPVAGVTPLVSFSYDFVWVAYVAALGRVAMMLAALDTGSSFEGMGAAREAVLSAVVEPVLFVTLGALALATRGDTLHSLLTLPGRETLGLLRLSVVSSLFVVLQVEASRMPVDDPTTHLELTMIHEVMVLDHSGPDLAAIQVATAVKLLVGTSMIASLLNPWADAGGLVAWAAHVVLCTAVAVVIGTVESLMARLKLRCLPHYVALGLGSSIVALVAAAWRLGRPA